MHTNNKVTFEKLSDEILIAQVAQGNVTALENLYDRHAATILGIAFKIIGDRAAAENVLRETFWQVWQNALTNQLKEGSLRGWMFKLARDLAVDAYHQRGVHSQGVAEMVDANPVLGQPSDPHIDIPDQSNSSLKAQRVQNALISLPREERQVIEMAYLYKMTGQEIAARTGKALGTVHTLAQRGLKKLREELEREIGFEGWDWKEK